MGTQAKWRDEWWGVTNNRVRSIESFDTDAAVKLTTDDEEKTCKINGSELENLKISFSVSVMTGGNPRAELENLHAKVGKFGTFYLNGRRFGPLNFQLTNVSADNLQMNNSGEILVANISLDFIEYDTDGSKNGAAPGAEKPKILYNNVDIYDKISVNSLFYDSYAESQADSVKIVFTDTKRVWDGWKPENEKPLRVKQGRLDTGDLYIHSIKPTNGQMTLTAYSIPPTSKNETSKSWEKVRFLQLAEEVAKRHGLAFEAYEVQDRTYTYIRQGSVPDFEFLEERAKLEGCAFLVYNKKLILYSEKALEAQSPTKTITLKENSRYTYSNNSAKKVKRFKVINSEFAGSYETKDTDSTKEMTQKLNIKISDQAEADRFARNFLRARNKTGQTGEYRTSLQDDVAAGSVLNIKTVGIKSWDGPAFVYHVRHDLSKNTSKIWIRKPIND